MTTWMRATRASLVALLLLTGCSCGDAQSAADGGGPTDAAGSDATDAEHDADAGEPWDPVWHETEAKQWTTIDSADVPECGEGCRIGLHIAGMHPAFYGHASSTAMLAEVSTDDRSLFFAALGGPTAVRQGNKDAREGFVEQALWGDYVSYLRILPHDGSVGANGYPENGYPEAVEVMSTKTGEVKTAYSLVQKEGDLGVGFTALNAKYVFWERIGQGIMSRNLQTGEVRVLAQLECRVMYATDSGLLCFEAGNTFIDQETGAVTQIEPGSALQTDSSCSVDRTRIIWVDYRDPPGPGSDFMGYRNGGEVYMKDLGTGEMRRLTHDSPDTPRAKAFPAVGEELAVWKEARSDLDPNPSMAQYLYAAAKDLVVLDLKKGTRCRIHQGISECYQFMSVHGRWVYGTGCSGYVIGIDVDHPSNKCEPY